jgi:hypothetical protein
VILNIIEASAMNVPALWGQAAFVFGLVAIGMVFIFFAKER